MKELKKAQMGMIAILTLMLVSITRRLPTRKFSSGITTLALAGIVLLVAAGGASANCIGDAPPYVVYGPGSTVTESCTFNADMPVCPNNAPGLYVGASGITIDGAGYKMIGARDAASCNVGILFGGAAPPTDTNPAMHSGIANIGDWNDVEITDLEIEEFCTGIALGSMMATNVDFNKVTNCSIHDCGDPGSSTHGIHMVQTNYSSVKCNSIHNIDGSHLMGCSGGGNGIFMYGDKMYEDGWHNSFACNDLSDNAKSGFFMKHQCMYNYLGNNYAVRNGEGGIVPMCMRSHYNTYDRNNMSYNGKWGFMTRGTGNNIINNTIIGNGAGPMGPGAGISIAASATPETNVVDDNCVCGNTGTDIKIDATCICNDNTCDVINGGNGSLCPWNCDDPTSVYYDFDEDASYSGLFGTCNNLLQVGAGNNPGLFGTAGASTHCDGGFCIYPVPGDDLNDCGPSAPAAQPYYCDFDGDGYFNATPTGTAEELPPEPDCQWTQGDDCDDTDAAINPGAAENCTDGIDNDCDELVDGDDPDCFPNKVYFMPEDSHGDASADFFVEVRVNATDVVDAITTNIAFDPTCINITDVEFDPSWTALTGWSHEIDYIKLGASQAEVCGPCEDRLVATLTIHCEDCCASSLSFTGTENVTRKLECTPTGVATNWINGSVICGTPVGVEKTVWKPATQEWVDEMDVQDLDTSVTFNYTVHAACCNLTDVVVTDQMDVGLKYFPGNATVEPDWVEDDGRRLVWENLGNLDVGETITIEFNATTVDYGVLRNVVTVTGLCDGIAISADDDAVVRMGMPKIAVEPIETIVQPQEQFDINITVDPNGACEVYGVEYDLHYDPKVLRAESLVKGPFLGEISETMVTYINIDTVNGIVSYAETRKDPPCPGGVADPGVVTRIHFTTIGEREDNTTLTLTDVIIVDNATMEAFEPVDIINGNVSITNNMPPVPIPQSKHRINNVAQKYPSTATLCSCSYDPDGVITYLRWAFGDGQYGTCEGLHSNNCTCKKHDYESYQWEPYGDPNGYYVNFSATLTVTDDGCPEESNSTSMNVTVYIAGDASGDGKVNVLDAVRVGKHWREACCTSPPCDPCLNCESYLWADEQADGADLNNDCKINVLDAVIIGANWRHTAW